jgi:serine/threonine protein phosphatase 1
MIYVTSDIHGCYDQYLRLIQRLDLKEDDRLYILGDLVDRGIGGIEIIKDVMNRKNVVCLRGNHDYYASIFLKRFALQDHGAEDERLKDAFRLWLEDGGAKTFLAFSKLDDNEKRSVLCFLDTLPFYEKICVNGQRFFLSHTVGEKAKILDIEKCDLRDFVFGEPEYDKCYFEDMTIVTGHTPTGFIDPAYTGRIWKGNRHIAVDRGAVFGNPLGCICLATVEEIYIE